MRATAKQKAANKVVKTVPPAGWAGIPSIGAGLGKTFGQTGASEQGRVGYLTQPPSKGIAPEAYGAGWYSRPYPPEGDSAGRGHGIGGIGSAKAAKALGAKAQRQP